MRIPRNKVESCNYVCHYIRKCTSRPSSDFFHNGVNLQLFSEITISFSCFLRLFNYYNLCRSIDELRKDAVDTICALAVAMGGDFAIFVPSVRKPMQRHQLHVGYFS